MIGKNTARGERQVKEKGAKGEEEESIQPCGPTMKWSTTRYRLHEWWTASE